MKKKKNKLNNSQEKNAMLCDVGQQYNEKMITALFTVILVKLDDELMDSSPFYRTMQNIMNTGN